ncbi:hypothetical protein ZIOFF_064808 [Zingiber officinale]|uniref:dUTPase-like domain-containing protein n=1 Tax=Zingiber officinale TaxID=94328 RepID=A0A8J5EWD5_ZINOF|nr:hypothetical protein ZIOFF_064808 [Zingiber officinale]
MDNKWTGDQSILTTMEIDLAQGSQLVYVIPDIMLTMGDFFRNIQVSILTRGYEQWSHGEANLLITRGLVGRLSNTSNVGFAYEVQGVMDYLTSHDVQALPGRRAIQFNDKDEETQSDEESFHTLAVLIDNASGDQTSKNQHEILCFDLMASKACIIEPGGRGLMHIRLSLEIPRRSYGCIAARSSAAWKFDLDIGVGIIDYLKLPEPSWEDEDIIPLRECLSENHTRTTSPWTSVPRCMDLSDDATDIEDDFLSHIQYLANLTTPIASPEPTDTIWDSYQDTSEDEWLNPLALEGDGKKPSQIIATGFEMDYPSLRRIMEIDSQSTPIQLFQPQ